MQLSEFRGRRESRGTTQLRSEGRSRTSSCSEIAFCFFPRFRTGLGEGAASAPAPSRNHRTAMRHGHGDSWMPLCLCFCPELHTVEHLSLHPCSVRFFQVLVRLIEHLGAFIKPTLVLHTGPAIRLIFLIVTT